jgi:hypothetical protein
VCCVKVSSRHWLAAAVSFRFCETRTSAARNVVHVSVEESQRGTVDTDCSDVALPRFRVSPTVMYLFVV